MPPTRPARILSFTEGHDPMCMRTLIECSASVTHVLNVCTKNYLNQDTTRFVVKFGNKKLHGYGQRKHSRPARLAMCTDLKCARVWSRA